MSKIQMPIPQRARRGLSPFEQRRLRAQLRRSACSETWVDDQIVTVTDLSPDGEELEIAWFDSPSSRPVAGRGPRMRWCRACGRYTPRPAIHLIEHRKTRFGPVISATLQCDDCRIAVDEEIHRELYQAGLHLRPLSSQSFVLLRTLFSDRKHGR